MFRSLHMKLMLILLLLITSLMAVVGAFLTTSVSSFYINTFYQQMADVFGEDDRKVCPPTPARYAHTQEVTESGSKRGRPSAAPIDHPGSA